MIKLTIEIKDEKFIYDYEVAKCRHHGDGDLSPEGLSIFINALNICHKAFINQHEEFFEKVKAGACVERLLKEKHPKLFEQVDTILRGYK